jgi:Uma2 family endonuclease
MLIQNFIIELRSPSDSLKDLPNKMTEYMDNGAQLGWLLDPLKQQVEIYRLGQPAEALL